MPTSLLEKHLVFSRIPGADKEYVQDRMRTEGDDASPTCCASRKTHIYICGLKGMEAGVEEALADICRKHGLDWAALKPEMRAERPLSRRDVLIGMTRAGTEACKTMSIGQHVQPAYAMKLVEEDRDDRMSSKYDH